ncbi:MAG: Ig-like domain-containing protein [Acidimicrobiales bacterium]
MAFTSTLVVGTTAVEVSAGEQVPCGYGLYCGPLDITTAPIRTWEPWDRIIQPNTPAETADGQVDSSIAWEGLEAEARAAVAALHGVPNDRRIVENARDEVIAYMFDQLVSILAREKNGQPVTAVERGWADHLQREVKSARIAEAERALSEYARWQSDPCNFQPPSGFGFAAYVPGAFSKCAENGTGSTILPAPPTAEQFAAYGAALSQDPGMSNADAAAAWVNAGQTILMFGGAAAGASYAAILAELIAISPEFATAIVNAIGSSAASEFVIVGAGGGTIPVDSAAVAGVATAAAFSAAVAIAVAVAVTIAGTWREIATAEVPVKLDKFRTDAEAAVPTPAAILANDHSLSEAFGVLFSEAAPTFEAERLAASTPAAHDPASDPEWILGNGTRAAELRSISWDGLVQRTYMADGWFVTSTDFGPYEWTGTLRFRGPGGGFDSAFLQGDRMVVDRAPRSTAEARSVVLSDTIVVDDLSPTGQTVRIVGNHAPSLAPTITSDVQEGTSFTMRANATDADGDQVQVHWLLQPQWNTALIKSCVDSPYSAPGVSTCAWARADGDTLTWTYDQEGRYLVRVFAVDATGATTEQRFDVLVGNVAPTLTVDPTTAIAEGGTARISGSFTDPGDDQIRLRIDWGDGSPEFSTRFPCPVALAADGTCPAGQSVFAGAADPTTWFATHRYVGPPPASGIYPVTVRVDDGVAVTTRSVTQAVDRSGMSIEVLSAWDVAEGGTSYIGGRLHHAARDAFDFEVDFGDGSPPAVYSYPCSPGTSCVFSQTPTEVNFFCNDPCEYYWFAIPHVFADGPSNPTITVRAVRGGLVAATRTTSAAITNVGPTVQLNPSGLDPDATSVLTNHDLVVRGFVTDPGVDAGVLTVSWGDESTPVQYPYPCSGDGCVFSTSRPYTDVCPTGGCDNGKLFFTLRHRYSAPSGTGGYRIALDASDEDGGPAAQRTRSVEVLPASNGAPTAQSTRLGTPEDTPLDGSFAALVDDDVTADGGLTLTITDAPDHGTLTVAGLTFHYVPAADYAGPDSFSYRVTDTGSPAGCGAPSAVCFAPSSAEARIDVDVSPVPDAPVVSLSGPTSVSEGTTATFTYGVTDGDPGDTIGAPAPVVSCGAAGTLVAGSATVSATGGTFRCSFPSGPTTSTVRVDLVDSTGLAGSAGTTVTVDDAAPTITVVTVSPARPVVGERWTVTARVDDAGGDAASVSILPGDGAPASVSQVAAGQVTTFTWVFARAGRYTTTITATSQGSSTTRAIQVEVLGGGAALDDLAARLAAIPTGSMSRSQRAALTRAIDGLRGADGGRRTGAADLVATRPAEALERLVAAVDALGSVPGADVSALRILVVRVAQSIAVDQIAAAKVRTGCTTYTARTCSNSEARHLRAAETALAAGDAFIALTPPRVLDAARRYATAVDQAIDA